LGLGWLCLSVGARERERERALERERFRPGLLLAAQIYGPAESGCPALGFAEVFCSNVLRVYVV